LELKYIIHIYYIGHISKNEKLRDLHPTAKIVCSERAYGILNVKIDVKFNDPWKIYIGNICLEFLSN